MKNFSIAFLLLLCSVLSCKKDDDGTQPPTTGTIQGQVKTATGDSVIVGAGVATSPPTSSVSTSAQGNYTIPNVPPGQYSVTAAKSGYNAGSANISVIAGQTTTANIQLNYLAGNNPPNPPSLVSPTNNSSDQAITVTLSWNCTDPDGDPLTYDIYFGKTNPPSSIVATNRSASTLDRTGLETSTTYYWKVVAKDNRGGSVSSDTWRFATSPFTNTWNASIDFSITNNPNGAWSYGRKLAPNASSFNLFTQVYNGQNWWFGNYGHGGPAVQSGPNLWAKDNSNGFPVVRWTSPSTGAFALNSTFIGIDGRGVNVLVYIALNDSVIFSHNVTAYLDSTTYSANRINLNRGDHIDFLIKWNAGCTECAWTLAKAIIRKYGG